MQPAARAFAITPTIRREIVRIIDDRIKEAHVTKEDFSELKSIVKDLGVKVGELADAQKRTEVKVEELAEAQKRTEVKVEELAQAQKRTEVKLEELAEAQRQTTLEVKALAIGLKDNRDQIGGLSQSFGYAFENEAYRFLPKLLEEKHGLKINERIMRSEIGGEEINIFCRAWKDDKEVLVVGESKLRLDDRRAKQDAFTQLDKKIAAVKAVYGETEIVPVLITHFATKGILALAKEDGVLVVQSFEW